MNKILPAACLSFLCLTAQAYQSADEWQFSIAPYLWAMNLNGDSGIEPFVIPINQNFGDLWSNLNFAGMLYFDGHYKSLGVFLNTIYTKISTSETFEGDKAKITNVYGIVTPAVSYQVVKNYQIGDKTLFTFEPYAGVRVTINNTTLKFMGENTSSNQDWGDAIIGTKLIFKFGEHWTLDLMGDFGGTTSPDQYSYNAVAVAGYEFGNTVIPISLFFGYSFLHQTYITDTFYWDMNINGPMLGIDFQF